ILQIGLTQKKDAARHTLGYSSTQAVSIPQNHQISSRKAGKLHQGIRAPICPLAFAERDHHIAKPILKVNRCGLASGAWLKRRVGQVSRVVSGGGCDEGHKLYADGSCSTERRDPLYRPCVCAGRWRGGAYLRNQNSAGVPRLASDHGGSRGGQQ